jgi:outer membrane protein OmpA-like peptidoglycan-associated protein
MLKRFFLIIYITTAFLFFAQAQVLTATSSIDWNNNEFTSHVVLDLKTAGFTMPSGRNAAVNKIRQQLPELVKSPLLGIPVDDTTLLGDTVLLDYISLEDLTNIVDDSGDSPGIYSGKTDSISMDNIINLHTIAALMVKHHIPYQSNIPIDQVSSRAFTGIVIDMRGSLPVHGEFVQDTAVPCFFPKIYDEEMNLIYEKNMTDPLLVKQIGIVQYSDSLNENDYKNRVGARPLQITAREVYGVNRTDPIISKTDALKILSKPENLELLKQGRVVLLMNSEALIYKASSPLKDEPYYFAYKELKKRIVDSKINSVNITDSPKGLLISIRDLKFKADTATLLSDENERLDTIAQALINITKNNENTILVEGHTASVGKPWGEQELSLQRAQTIIAEMVKRGVPENLFSYRGYGGTIPIGDNATPEGRALNRRVEITVVPKATYIQRSN